MVWGALALAGCSGATASPLSQAVDAGDAGGHRLGSKRAPDASSMDAPAPEASVDAVAPTRDAGTTPETSVDAGSDAVVDAAVVVGGACSPDNALSCSDDRVTACMNGVWHYDSSPCEYACQAGACAGVCLPGAVQCAGLQPQLCGADFEWANYGPPCQASCVSSAGDCGG